MFQFSLFRIPITVHGWFFLLAAFLGGAFSAQSSADWQRVLVFIAAAFVSIIVHELGHALIGRKLGAPLVQISLHGMGGAASFPGASFSRKHRILMTAAGPGASILLAIVSIATLIGLSLPEPSPLQPRPLLGYFLSVMVGINVFWTVINLCPVLPLDGGQILRDLLGPARLKLTCIVSFITLALLALLLWSYTGSIYNMIVMAFLGSYTWRVYQQA